MSSFMIYNGTLISESFITKSACKWFFSRVHSFMNFQVSFFIKGLIASLILTPISIRRLEMNVLKVNLESVFSRKTFITFKALECFIIHDITICISFTFIVLIILLSFTFDKDLFHLLLYRSRI